MHLYIAIANVTDNAAIFQTGEFPMFGQNYSGAKRLGAEITHPFEAESTHPMKWAEMTQCQSNPDLNNQFTCEIFIGKEATIE